MSEKAKRMEQRMKFNDPILNYCYQHRGEPGIKAILIYPMNALTTELIYNSALKGRESIQDMFGKSDAPHRSGNHQFWKAESLFEIIRLDYQGCKTHSEKQRKACGAGPFSWYTLFRAWSQHGPLCWGGVRLALLALSVLLAFAQAVKK